MIAQPIYPLMVHRPQQAKVALAASSLIVGQAVQKTSPKKETAGDLEIAGRSFKPRKRILFQN